MSKEILPCFAACEAINPKNPEMVAETLPEIFKLLQAISDLRTLQPEKFDEKYPRYDLPTIATIVNRMAIDAKNLLEKSTDNLPF